VDGGKKKRSRTLRLLDIDLASGKRPSVRRICWITRRTESANCWPSMTRSSLYLNVTDRAAMMLVRNASTGSGQTAQQTSLHSSLCLATRCLAISSRSRRRFCWICSIHAGGWLVRHVQKNGKDWHLVRHWLTVGACCGLRSITTTFLHRPHSFMLLQSMQQICPDSSGKSDFRRDSPTSLCTCIYAGEPISRSTTQALQDSTYGHDPQSR
jgi:hypothetical protein